MSTAAMQCIPTDREDELVQEARRIIGGKTLLFPTTLHLLACVVRMDAALDVRGALIARAVTAEEQARLATEALERVDREQLELLEQLYAERARRIDLENAIEQTDRHAGDVLMAASLLSNRSAEAKRVVASPLHPEPAGYGAGV